jgi:hypothetical protein
MISRPAVFLFDLDGVLVQPGGYRAAVAATINYFTIALGLGESSPGEETIALFESQGITNEWDIIPICLGTIFETILRAHPETELPASLDHLDGIHLTSPDGKLDFETPVLHTGRLTQAGMSPSEAIYYAGEGGPFPRLAHSQMFTSLFAHSQDVVKSTHTRIFQNFVMGSAAFEQVYRQPAPMASESFLKQFDQRLLEAGLRDQVEVLSRNQNLHLAVCTARPSLPPVGIEVPGPGYSPEAEQALELVGLGPIPLIGAGRLLYIAAAHDVSFNLLIKPSPFQAAAATLAAVSGNEQAGLLKALSVCQQAGVLPGQINPSRAVGAGGLGSIYNPVRPGQPLPVHIFEDSPIGLRSAQQAGMLLSLSGFPVSIHAWGISANPAKIKTLEAAGAAVFPDINQAIRAILTDSRG